MRKGLYRSAACWVMQKQQNLPLKHPASAIPHCFHRRLAHEAQPPRAPPTAPGAPVARVGSFSPCFAYKHLAATGRAGSGLPWDTAAHVPACAPTGAPLGLQSGPARAAPPHAGSALAAQSTYSRAQAHCVTAQAAMCLSRSSSYAAITDYRYLADIKPGPKDNPVLFAQSMSTMPG